MPNLILTKPIINSLLPVDVSSVSGINIPVTIGGGDIVNQIIFTITNITNVTPSVVGTITKVVNDNSGEEVRTFIIRINFGTGAGEVNLTNDAKYTITAQSQNTVIPNNIISSTVSDPQLILCFPTPSLSFYLQDSTELTNNYTLTASSVLLTPSFVSNSQDASVYLSSYDVKVVGYGSNAYTNIYETPTLYTMDNILLSPFYTTNQSSYSYYLIRYNGITNYGMVFNGEIKVYVNYTSLVNLAQSTFSAINICDKGYIKVNADLSTASNISHVIISRKIVNTNPLIPQSNTEWISLMDVLITNTYNKFNIIDTYNQCGTTYTYRLTPYDANENEGVSLFTTVYSYFNGAFICDNLNSFSIYNMLEYSSYQKNQGVGVYNPFASKYPLFTINNKMNYNSGSLSFVPLSQSTMNSNGDIDRLQEVKNREIINEYLINHYPKILKDYNGNIWVIFITENPTNSFYSNLGNGISSSNFSWSEIASLTQDGLDDIGMLGYFPIEYILENSTIIVGRDGNIRNQMGI